MIDIGKMNFLPIVRQDAAGVYVDGGELGALFVSASAVPTDAAVGSHLSVFVYRSGDAAWVATTQKPLAQVGDIAWLRVVAVSAAGAFLDWGLPKDLLVPHAQQRHEMLLGQAYMVKVLFDPDKGIAATSYLDAHLSYTATGLEAGQPVSLLIAETTDLGFKAIVNNQFWGLLYQNELFQPLRKGQRINGYVKQIRVDDQRLDLSLYPTGFAKVAAVTGKILHKLQQAKGFLPLTDKSPPEVIYSQLGISKKVFKQAIGHLYKQQLIDIEATGIRQMNVE